MAETCSICKREFEKGDGRASKSLKITLVRAPAEAAAKEAGAKEAAAKEADAGKTGAAASAEKTTLEVPRCPECTKKASTWAWRGGCILALVGAVIGDLLLTMDKNASGIEAYGLLLLGAAVGAVIGYLGGKALRHNYELQQAEGHASVKALVEAGWKVERNP
jgi:hypothetical protein